MAVVEVTNENFISLVEGHAVVVVAFCTPQSESCAIFAPIFAEAAATKDNALFCECSLTVCADVVRFLEIESAPAIVLFRDGLCIFKQEGAPDEEGLEILVNQALALDMEMVRRELESA